MTTENLVKDTEKAGKWARAFLVAIPVSLVLFLFAVIIFALAFPIQDIYEKGPASQFDFVDSFAAYLWLSPIVIIIIPILAIGIVSSESVLNVAEKWFEAKKK